MDFNILLLKAGIAAACAVSIFGGGWHYGSAHVQHKWDSDKAAVVSASLKLVQQHAKEITDLKTSQAKHNLEVSNAHETSVQVLNTALADARAVVSSHGGLRVAAGICAGRTAPPASAASNSGHDAAVTATVALPDDVTNNLLQLASEADKVTEVARACQAWVRKQGFYGPAQ